MVTKYNLQFKDKDIPKGVSLLTFGNVFIQKEAVKYPNKMEYIHNECVGWFIEENGKDNIININTIRDFGDKVGCIFKTKDSVDVYHLSGYDRRDIIEDIMLTTEIEKNTLIANKIENEDKI